MLNLFIGFDKAETVAYHVLAQSILSRASIPITICPLNRDNLKGIYTRERGPLESTDFSMSRFLAPYLSNYEGWSVFMDCDMLCLADIAELMALIKPEKNHAQSVYCVQHSYTPRTATKFLGQAQTQYPMKNWSSLMVFNNSKCRDLTPDVVNSQSGLFLHQFQWADGIGSIPLEWNWLIDEYQGIPESPKMLHFTNGTPCFEDYQYCTGANLWHKEANEVISPLLFEPYR